MKALTNYVCQQCGYQSPSFMGKCPECGQWNSLVESVDSTRNGKSQINTNIKYEDKIFKLSDVKALKMERVSTGIGEFDRVLGGGIVPGSISLISGEPGIGKSTLLLECAMTMAKSKSGSILYVSGEESAQQVKIRADRIGKIPDNIYILAETDVEVIIAASEKISPRLLVIDSIQTLTTSQLNSSAGSLAQLRECSQQLQRYAKKSHTPIFLVGHVTKEGNIAGPKVLEHLVDAVLNLEGDEMYAYRMLRSAKNRFGSTFEVGVFEMQDVGMVEVKNPSKIFLENRAGGKPGSSVVATVAGGRPILVEVQALVTPTTFPVPTRRVSGLDFNRVQVVIASLSRVAKLNLSNLDIFVNVAGGLKVSEPAADLGIALSIVSSVRDLPLKKGLCLFGEVGLLGELRGVSNTKPRVAEAKRLGFSTVVSFEKFKRLEEAVAFSLLK